MFQRRQIQRRQQNANRVIRRQNRQRRIRFINNLDTLSRIANLPQQIIDDNSTLDQFFNG
ncbi:13076_t:CDS:2 [Funneliformis mosseae]|uniref:13076_t:CDS:1 n=1 Tax=Funneliformis mosseae TaxID=27381 RepID=A0A9N8WDG4_FUNMO|nr:13076_t:CDS:2 [Funneliformis mosseae]